MKLSVQTYGATNGIGVDAGFAAIKSAGFDAVDMDLSVGYNYDDLLKGIKSDFFDDDKIYPYMDEVCSAAKKYGIEFGQAHAPFPTFIKDSPQGSLNVQEDVRKSIGICGYIGCHRLIIHPLFDGSARFPCFTKEEEYKVNIDFYTSLIPLLKKHDVICCLENMWKEDWKSKEIYEGPCSNIEEAIRYIDELNAIAGEKRFGFCLDTGHLLLLGQDPCYWIQRLGDRLETLHIHDNDGVRDGHTLPYIGVGNWDRFILALRRIGYRGSLNFETATFNEKFPKELIPSALRMIRDVGNYFRSRIMAETDETDGKI